MRCCGRTLKLGRSRAFFIAEVLLSVLILSLISAIFFAPFKNGMHLLRLLRDQRIAQQRILTIRAILGAPARFCALGVPTGAQDYKESLGSRSGRFFSWAGPVSVVKGKNGEEGGCLRIVFAYPLSCRTSAERTVGKSASSVGFDRKLDAGYFDADIYDKPGSVKNWVTFANSDPPRSPLVLSKFYDYSLALRSLNKDEVVVPKGERLLLFRVMECWAGADEIFYTNDYRTAGAQPRENGICDVRFSADGQLLTVYVVARGEDKDLSPGRIEGEEKCTAEILSQWKGKSEYVLYCEKFVFYMPNAAR